MPATSKTAPERPDAHIVVYDVIGNVAYEAQAYQEPFHESEAPNLLALGTRGTGKSLMLRWDAVLRCLMVPYFPALILRRTMPELRQSHLKFIGREMKLLGGRYIEHPQPVAKFPNGSTIVFGHCETEKDILNYLSSEYGYIGFDELSTFLLNQYLQISASARAPEGAPYHSVVRAGSNTLGPGSGWMKQWFIDKTVDLGMYPDYHPDDFEMQYSSLDQNKYVQRADYEARLKNLPEHVRESWLEGKFITEGAYFTDFKPRVRLSDATKETKPWHVIDDVPVWTNPRNGERLRLLDLSWLSIYRAVDWGYSPDPAVCLWFAVLPNKRTIVFKEKTWKRTLAADVAADIKRESEGMRGIDTFCDPTMAFKEGQTFSIADLFEQNGVPLTPSKNDRRDYGYAIHNYLNTLIDNQPQLQIVQPLGMYGCPELIRTIPLMTMDKTDTRKLADGDDHWVVALAYFCMGAATPAFEPRSSRVPEWMRPRTSTRISL